MKTFECSNCNQPLHFETTRCDNCGNTIGYEDVNKQMLSFDSSKLQHQTSADFIDYKYCKNKMYDVCNWLIPKQSHQNFCEACELNRTIPNLNERKNFKKWKSLELAKHRLIYQLQKLQLPLNRSKAKNDGGLCFDFIAKLDDPKIMTGHVKGVITILLREADSVIREQTRKQLKERYRTLIGHLRHEVGHYYWDQLIYTNQQLLDSFRSVFGDERISYADALQHYYKNEPVKDWQNSFISKYATSHPWEDWAETWAHYLHIMDMVETAYYFNLHISPVNNPEPLATDVLQNPYQIEDFDIIVRNFIPLTLAVNSMNRAMGIPDVYPFQISGNMVHKLKFIHKMLFKPEILTSVLI
jgi:hypothetical protein